MTFSQRLYSLLADLVLLVHAAFVVFVVVGLLLIWVGRFCGWSYVRNLWFRLAHLVAIAFVTAETLAGFVCPLTAWEDRLRRLAGGETRYQDSFIQHWLHQVMFFDLDPHIFTVAYVVFFLVVALSLWFVPPRWSRRASPG